MMFNYLFKPIEERILIKLLETRNVDLKQLIKSLNRSQKFYFFGFLSTILGYIIGLIFSNPSILVLGLSLLFFGFISDILIVVHKLLETLIGKLIVIILTPIITTIGYAMANQIINEIIHYDMSGVTYATTFTAFLLMPFLLIFVAFIGLVIVMLLTLFLMLIYMVLDISKRMNLGFDIKENYPILTWGFRIILYSTVIGIIIGYWNNKNNQQKYENFTIRYTKDFLYYLEAKKYSRCANIPENAKVLTVVGNKDEIILASKDNDDYTFKAVECTPKIEKKK